MSISHENSIGRVIEDITLESDLSNVKVIAKANIEEMQIGSFNLEQKDKETKRKKMEGKERKKKKGKDSERKQKEGKGRKRNKNCHF